MNGAIGRDAALGRPVGAARRPYLNVRWLGRMDFARALALQEEIVAKTREDASLRMNCFFSNTNPFTRLGARRSIQLVRHRIRPSRDGELGGDICRIRFFRSTAAGKRRITGRDN